jgi:hypothetical protein
MKLCPGQETSYPTYKMKKIKACFIQGLKISLLGVYLCEKQTPATFLCQ